MGVYGVMTHSKVFLTQDMKAHWQSGGTATLTLNLKTKWRLVVSLTHRPS